MTTFNQFSLISLAFIQVYKNKTMGGLPAPIKNENNNFKKWGTIKMKRNKEKIFSERELYLRERILQFLHLIEEKTGIMVHEDDVLKDDFNDWESGKLKSSFFNMKVLSYYDELNR